MYDSGCQKFMKDKEENISGAPVAKKRRNLYDDIMSNRKLGLGSPELTKLWGKSESNLEACKESFTKVVSFKFAYLVQAFEDTCTLVNFNIDTKTAVYSVCR